VPVSLSKGHFRAPQFKINLESGYRIEIDTNPVFQCPSTLRASWSLSNGGRVVAEGTSDLVNFVLGDFEAGAGSYTLDLDVSGDAGCLDAGAPHVVVSESWGIGRSIVDDAMGRALATVLLLSAAGTFVLLRGRRERQAAWVTTYRLVQPGPLPPLPDARPRATPTAAKARPFSWTIDRNRHRKLWLPNVPAFYRLSWFSLLIINSVMVLIIIFMTLAPIQPVGLPVRLVRPGIPAQSTPGMEPLIVRVESVGPGARPLLYLNSQPIAWEDLGTVVQKELNRRPPHWPVYVEGDPYLMWGSVAQAIDIIRGANGEVVLLGSAMTSQRPSH
jgi:biopolymer transport protein ExbD